MLRVKYNIFKIFIIGVNFFPQKPYVSDGRYTAGKIRRHGMIRIKTLVPVMAILLLTLSAYDSRGADSPGIGSTSLPYKNLSANEIVSVTVKIPPQGFQVKLSDDEIEQFVAILRTVDTGNPAGSGIEYEGKALRFTLTMTNGTVKTITVHNPVVFMENNITVIPYKTDTCYALSEFGISAAESEYQQFLRKITNSVYAFSDSISHVKTGQVVIIELKENQSFPVDGCRTFQTEARWS